MEKKMYPDWNEHKFSGLPVDGKQFVWVKMTNGTIRSGYAIDFDWDKPLGENNIEEYAEMSISD